MTAPVNNLSAPGSLGVEQLKRPTDGTLTAEKIRLLKATKEFESFFIYQMLKTMRQTIPKDPASGETPMAGGMGKDTFTELFDMEIARKASFGGHNSISELLYRSMEKLIEAGHTERSDTIELAPLRPPTPAPQPLDGPDVKPLPERDTQPIKLDRSSPLQNYRTVRPNIATDPIEARFGAYIEEAAREHSLDSALIKSIIQAESAGNPRAESHAGAKGLMQLIDSTAAELGVRDSFDPRQNIRGGSRYLRQMLDRFGELDLALAAYNAGPGNVEKYNGVPPFEETRQYVKRVTEILTAAQQEENGVD